MAVSGQNLIISDLRAGCHTRFAKDTHCTMRILRIDIEQGEAVLLTVTARTFKFNSNDKNLSFIN